MGVQEGGRESQENGMGCPVHKLYGVLLHFQTLLHKPFEARLVYYRGWE